MAWWRDARFGMFIHWGLYALPARHEWVRNRERITNEQYQKYFEHFNPDLYNPREWARMAKEAGMKYVVLTAKHHEGFCLFDSKFTDYKATNTPCRRDLVQEYVEAFRAEGLKVGFYYSLIDWHHPDYTVDRIHPLRPVDKKDFTEENFAKLNQGRDMAKYRQYMKNQVRELLTNYGKISIVWFDFSFPGKFGKGRDDWDSAGLLKLARELQPHILVDNRLDLPGEGDFATPEQTSAADLKKKAKANQADWERYRDWETCQTFSGSWGYYRDEKTWKTNAATADVADHLRVRRREPAVERRSDRTWRVRLSGERPPAGHGRLDALQQPFDLRLHRSACRVRCPGRYALHLQPQDEVPLPALAEVPGRWQADAVRHGRQGGLHPIPARRLGDSRRPGQRRRARTI